MINKLKIRDVLITNKGNFEYCGCGYLVDVTEGSLIYMLNFSEKLETSINRSMRFRNYAKPHDEYVIKKIMTHDEYFNRDWV